LQSTLGTHILLHAAAMLRSPELEISAPALCPSGLLA